MTTKSYQQILAYPLAARQSRSDGYGGVGSDPIANTLAFRKIRLAVAAIERGAKIMGIDGREMHDRLRAKDLIQSYLLSGYEPLHTQSYEYVAESTVETLRNWEVGQ